MAIQTELHSVFAVSEFKRKLKLWLTDSINTLQRIAGKKNTPMQSHTTAQSHAPVEFSQLCHSLRTPLNAIIGFSELMKAQIYGPLGHNKYQDYSHAIAQSGEELLQQIEKLLNERGEQLPKIQFGEVEKITTQAAQSLKSIADQNTHYLITPAANSNSSIH